MLVDREMKIKMNSVQWTISRSWILLDLTSKCIPGLFMHKISSRLKGKHGFRSQQMEVKGRNVYVCPMKKILTLNVSVFYLGLLQHENLHKS